MRPVDQCAVFSKCSSTIPDGKRLEYLSWRVWARETLCCPPQPDKTIVPAIDIPRASKEDLPSLSNSLGSDTSDNCSLGSSHTSFENSALSKSRGKEQHLTPNTLEKIIKNIQEQGKEQEKQKPLEPLDPAIEAVVNGRMSPTKNRKPAQSPPQPQSPVSDRSDQRSGKYTTESSCLSTMTATTAATTISPECCNPHRTSETSVSSDGLIRSGSVVHGFSPVSSLRSRGSSNPLHNLPILASRNAAKNAPAKKGGMFTLGGSSEDDESSFETTMSYRKTLLEPRKSSLSRSITREQPHQKKTTSFKEIVEQHHTKTGGSEADDNAIASDDEDSDIDDSAIEEDDEEGDWEDEQAEEETPAHNPVFRRVDSAAHLPSRRSILTAGLTEGDRAKGLLSAASKSTSALRHLNRAASHEGPSMPGSPENDDDAGMMMRTSSNSRPIAIASPPNGTTYALAHSPRTTRRYMLSTELTESLRKNLLWERQQKNTTVNAFLKREARSMANLPRAGQAAAASASAVPAQPRPNPERDVTKHNSFNDYFNVTNEYHTKGW